MEYRSLGRTGMHVSVLSLGAMLFGGETDETEAAALVGRAIDAGVNSIDTANIYGRGRSEEHQDLLLAPALAHVATTGPRGAPRSTPIRIGWDGEHIRFSPTKRQQKYHSIRLI